MNVIDVFWGFINKHHPQLVNNDWSVDSKLVKRKDIVNPEVREFVPLDMLEVNQFVFYYEGSDKDIIFLLQDKKGKRNIAIALLSDNKLVDAIKL